jgi:hypothetical protein
MEMEILNIHDVFRLQLALDVRDRKIEELRKKLEMARRALRIMNAPEVTIQALGEKD